jgi:hypothetical protein
MTADRPTPLIALLTAHWESRTEEGWITRQVAGALACVADVQVITPDGEVAGTSVDSVFVVHRLASPIDPSSELRRELLLESIADASPGIGDAVPEELAGLIDRGLIDPWRGAGDVLAGLRPDQVLVVGHQNVGALDAVDRLGGDLPVSLVALGTDERSLASRHFDRLFDRAGAVLAVTESERSSIVAHHGGEEKVHAIGAPLAANTSVLGEPNTWVGAEGSLIVLTGVASDADHAETELARLIRIRFPDNPVGIVHTDTFDAWHRGRLNRGWAVERSSDLARLVAWAEITIDLHPGGLFARRCVESLLYGTPIVVPSRSRAREHAERGRGGLWFANPAELTWCVESLLETTTHDAFAHQGRTYAESEYGSTDRFIRRVVEGCGLDPDAGRRTVADVAAVR